MTTPVVVWLCSAPGSGCVQAGLHWGQRECGLPGALSLSSFSLVGCRESWPGADSSHRVVPAQGLCPTLRDDLARLGLEDSVLQVSQPCSLQGTLRLVGAPPRASARIQAWS